MALRRRALVLAYSVGAAHSIASCAGPLGVTNRTFLEDDLELLQIINEQHSAKRTSAEGNTFVPKENARQGAHGDGPVTGEQATNAETVLDEDLEQLDLPSEPLVKSGKIDPDALVKRARDIFAYLMNKSGFILKLNNEEARLFETRFIDYVSAGVTLGAGWSRTSMLGFMMMRPVISEAEITRMTAQSLHWVAKYSELTSHTSLQDFQNKLGKALPAGYAKRLRTQSLPSTRRSAVPIPSDFDARKQWPHCSSQIGRVLNQGLCGSCWAFASLSAIDSRLCIATQGKWNHSNDLLSRGYTSSCGTDGLNGCTGGLASSAYLLLGHRGVPTGGSLGCSPYFAEGEGSEHFQATRHAPPCPTSCQESYTRQLTQDLFRLDGIANYVEMWNDADGMMRAKDALLHGGPLSFGFFASQAFLAYAEGVFSHPSCDTQPNHEVLAIGWGGGAVPHFIAQNSWGPEWGMAGRFLVVECAVTDWTVPGNINVESSTLPLSRPM